MKLPDIARDKEVLDLIRRALKEDIGAGDITTTSLIPESTTIEAVIISHGEYVISGTEVARTVFTEVDPQLKCNSKVKDGQRVKAGQTVITIKGRARGILAAERTALNFIQRMTGIATLTRRFVEKAGRYGVTILDTRKTTPTLRKLEKYAVVCGGGQNHRMGLYDRILIKDNHYRLLEKEKRTNLVLAIKEVRKKIPGVSVEVEVENEAEMESVLEATPDWILLDNMSIEQLKRCVKLCVDRSRLEASGGITMENIEEVAKTGVDAISLGCITHSAPAADLSLEIV